MHLTFNLRKQIRRLSVTRRFVYGFLLIAASIGIIAKCVFLHRVSQYQRGKERLEVDLQNDERFRNVRIFFFSTRPSAFVLAPVDLPLNAKRELEHMVTSAFAPLRVPVQYADSNYFGSTK